MNGFTQPVKDGMRVRHDAKARFTVKSGRQVLEDSLIDVGTIGGAMTRASFTYNQLTMSGGVSWWNPTTGHPITRPKVAIRVRPADILTGDAECTCAHCEASDE